MEIREKIDNSKLRLEAESKNKPILELLMKKTRALSKKENLNYTLLAVCPNSSNVLKASLRAAKRADAPILFAATLNQVDIDGGYTGWTQIDLVRKIKEESYHIGYKGPIIICVDHGGPYVKDIQTIEKWDIEKAMNWTKKSFEAAVLAGYDLLHVDPTVDIWEKNIKIETVVDRTIDLILHVENFRKKRNLKPLSYEVGTEEVKGGLTDINVFKKFLKLLKDGLVKIGIGYVWPVFVVAKVGTDLHTTTFDLDVAKRVVNIVAEYNSYIKGHYTDFVENPGDYPESGMGAANVGPEFTIFEYDALAELSLIEDSLYRENKIARRSLFLEKIKSSVIESGRWKKWLREGEKDFNSLSKDRKDWILKTCSRYIWALPEIESAQNKLFNNLELNGIDARYWVISNIEKAIDKYFIKFNLLNLNTKL
jgi:D-tagatose-1,6-bisphosphate aldolase subunit GatZ/KbaZ